MLPPAPAFITTFYFQRKTIGFDMILTEWSFKTCFCLSVSWEHFLWVTPASRHICHEKGSSPFLYLPWVMNGYVWCLQVKLVSCQVWVCNNSHLFFLTNYLSLIFFLPFLIWWWGVVLSVFKSKSPLFLKKPKANLHCHEIAEISNITYTEKTLLSFLSSFHPPQSYELWGLWWWNWEFSHAGKATAQNWSLADRQRGSKPSLCGQFVSWLNMDMERSPCHHVSQDGLSEEPLPTDN